MFGKLLTPASLLVGLSLLHQVRAHTALIPMLSVAGTPERDDVRRPNNRNPCGRNVDVTAAAVEGSTAAVADATGAFTVTATNFNRRRDGSREVTAQVDSTATGQNFVPMTVTVNGDPAPRQLGSEQITATLPAGMTCTGGTAGNKCLVQFVTLSGFGNCVVVEQPAAAAAGDAAAGAAGGVAATGAATNAGDNTGIGATGAADTGVVNNGGDNTALPAAGTADTGIVNNGGDNTALPNTGTNAGTANTGINTGGDNTALPAAGTANTRVANTGVANTGATNRGAANAGTANPATANTRIANAGAANRGAAAGTANTGAARTANGAATNNGRVSGPAAANVAGTRAPRAARAFEKRAGRKDDDGTGCVEEFKRSIHEWLWA